MRTAHSDKALDTLKLMSTEAASWCGADVVFEQKIANVRGEVRCPTCDGGKWVRFQDNKPLPVPPRGSYDSVDGYYKTAQVRQEYTTLAMREASPTMWSLSGNCPTCKEKNSRARMYGHCTGKVPGMVQRLMWVGVVQWPVGTKFDSRFSDSGCNCNLCNKLVLKSNLVPVVGTDSAGNNHGMWVGADCAKKFLPGVYTMKTPDGKKFNSETAMIES